MSDHQAAGPRIVLTRDAAGCERWAADLRRLGGRPIRFPCLEIRHRSEPELAHEVELALSRSDWLCLSSARGVEALGALLGGRPGAPDLLPTELRVAVVGPASAAKAMEILGRVDLVAEPATARGLAESLWRLEGDAVGSVVVATADRGRRELEDFFAVRGVPCARFEIYATLPSAPGEERESLGEALHREIPASSADESPTRPIADAIALASPSAFEGLCHRVDLAADLPRFTLGLVTLGPTTSAAIRGAGWPVAAEAEEPTLEALYAAILEKMPAVNSPSPSSPVRPSL